MIVTIVVLGIAMAALASFYPLLAQLPDAEKAERAARNAESCAELIIAASRHYDEDEGRLLFDPQKDLFPMGVPLVNPDEDDGIYVDKDLWGYFCAEDGMIEVVAMEDEGEEKVIIEIGYDSASTVSGLDPLYLGFDR